MLAEHEKYLGRPPSEICSSLPEDRLNLEGIDNDTSAFLVQNKHEPVRITLSGIIGDSGLPHNHILLGSRTLPVFVRHGGASRFLAALQSRHLSRSAAGEVISRNGHFQSTHFAMENREILPPFFPGGNGEDGSFSTLLRFIYRGGLLAYLPFEYIHAPIPIRQRYLKGLSSIQTRANDLISRLIASRYKESIVSPSQAEDGLLDAGEYFKSLSLLPHKEFGELVREINVSFFSSYVRFLEHTLSNFEDPPDFVHEAYNRHFDAVQEYLLSPRVIEIADLAVDPAKQIPQFQTLLNNFGRLLMFWPQLHAICRRANAEGLQMGRRI